MSAGAAYRLRAAEFGAKARSEINPSKRAEYDALSLSYLRLAEQAERNAQANIVYEQSPTVPQQQQQQQQRASPEKEEK